MIATLQSLGSPAALSHDALVLTARRLADDLALGTDASIRIGSGVEYAQSRPYRPGDSLRRLDWRVTARKGEPYTREFEALHRLPVYIIADTSASMVQASVPVSKSHAACWLAAALGLIALRRMSPVAIVSGASTGDRLAPSLRQDGLWSSLETLTCPDKHQRTNLARALQLVTASAPSVSVIFILSDFHDASVLAAVARCSSRHDVVLIQLCDPAEVDALPGFIDAAEAETGARSIRFAGARVARARDEFLAMGLDPLTIRTDLPFIAQVRRFLAARGGGSRRAR
jgi:uncharacterized protein (DUF58 family)